MFSQQPDVSRLYQHFGLDPSDYLQFRSPSLSGQVVAVAAAASPSSRKRPHISDPAVRAARLRAELLGAASG